MTELVNLVKYCQIKKQKLELIYSTVLFSQAKCSDILDIVKREENGTKTTKGKVLLLHSAVQAIDQPAQALGTPKPAEKGKPSEIGTNAGACGMKH